MWLPSSVFHSCTVLSLLPEATRLPSGDKTTALTAEERFAEISTSRPVAASQTRTVLSELAEATRRLSGAQTRTVLSSPPEAMRFPSGDHATAITEPV